MAEQTELCGRNTASINGLREDVNRHEELLQKVQNRPPVWCTIIISVLTFALGWTLNYARTNVAIQPKASAGTVISASR